MGLDMFAFKVRKGTINEAVDFEVPENADDQSELHYWRKHPNLHGWMEDLYYRKGGQEGTFNCVNVQLTEEDLKELENAIKAGELPDTAGFFFGESDGSEKKDDLKFVKDAKEAIKEGYDVYYTSWW